MNDNRKKLTISAYTLGCKVNQYDTSAMLEEFISCGYELRPLGEKTDIVLINTCTVTGTGDNKSLKMIRRCARENPNGAIIVAGCLAQREAELVAGMPNVRLVVGTKKRSGIVAAFEEAVAGERPSSFVEDFTDVSFENVSVDSAESRTRAVLKIQEGCKNRCSYCAIPLARGPVRSRSIESIRAEVGRLSEKGFAEIVLTGVHLNSYGLDFGSSMAEAVAAALTSAGKSTRIRLGSLEPNTEYAAFAQAIGGAKEKLCPQFHLSLQSGSDAVLARMRRRYNTYIYRKAVNDLRGFFPGCAITTDIIAGFPGETDAEFAQTLAFMDEIGFARVHAFPYSERSGTDAAAMPGAVPMSVRQQRAGMIIEKGDKLAKDFARSKLGKVLEVVFEEQSGGISSGYCQHYIRCFAPGDLSEGISRFLAKEEIGGALHGEII